MIHLPFRGVTALVPLAPHRRPTRRGPGRLERVIRAAGGPAYDWRQFDPQDKSDGAEPGSTRVALLFRTDRGT